MYRLVDRETGEKASETEIHERAERHRHSWLSTIGAEALPPELHAELVRLDGAFGPINDPGTPPGMIRVSGSVIAFQLGDRFSEPDTTVEARANALLPF